MSIVVETKDCTALGDAELAEMADHCADQPYPYEIGLLSKQAEAWVLVAQARENGKLKGFAFFTLERIGGTPSVLLGLASVKRTSKRDSVLRAMMTDVLRRAVLDLAQARDPSLADWIASAATFPCTMVDRIVPAATPATLDEIAAALGGVRDECAIACEPFIQWVVEDNFAAGRPAWELAGAQLVRDVLPFEHMKLRMLNGSHSFLAYLGYLGGYRYINECMADEHYRRAAQRLMLCEQAPTLSVTGISLPDYAAQLIARFSNPALQHLTWQIAMDGTQKLPQRLLDAVRWHLRHGGDYSGLALGVAGWMRYVGGVDDAGQPIDIRDPLADVLQQTIAATPDDRRRVTALLALKSVFGEQLATHAAFIEAVTQAYLSLRDRGARETVKEWVKQ